MTSSGANWRDVAGRMFGWRVLYWHWGQAREVPCHWKCAHGAILAEGAARGFAVLVRERAR